MVLVVALVFVTVLLSSSSYVEALAFLMVVITFFFVF